MHYIIECPRFRETEAAQLGTWELDGDTFDSSKSTTALQALAGRDEL